MTSMKRSLVIAAWMLGTLGAQAQDLIIAKQGDPVKAWNLEVSDKYVFYSTEPGENAPIVRMAKENILMIRKADGSAMNFTGEQTGATTTAAPSATPDAPIIDEGNIHGNLIAEGNCVYIPTDSPLAYEQAGQQRVKEYMKQWGYWKVVEKPEQAHFVLQFTTQISGETSPCSSSDRASTTPPTPHSYAAVSPAHGRMPRVKWAFRSTGQRATRMSTRMPSRDNCWRNI